MGESEKFFAWVGQFFSAYSKYDVNLLSRIALIKLPLILCNNTARHVLWSVNSCVIDANAIFLTHNYRKTTILSLGLFYSGNIILWGVFHTVL